MSATNQTRFAVVLPNWIGDVVMATPVLRSIKEQFPESHLTGIMRPYVSQVLEGTTWLDEEILFDPKSDDAARRTRGVISKLRKQRPDKILLLTNSLRAAAIGFFGGARQRIGFVRNGRGPLLNKRLYAEKENGDWKPVPTIDYYLDVARAAGIEPASKQMELETVTRDEELARRIIDVLGLSNQPKLVVFNSGGARGAAKSWPPEHFVELAKRVRDQWNAAVLILAGPAEMEVAHATEQSIGDPLVKSMANPLVREFIDSSVSLGAAKALVKRADIMVTTDSGPRHFAHAFRTPVVALYGANNPQWTVPYDDQSRHLWEQLDCSFCEKRTCPLGHHNCMKNLQSHRVFAAMQTLIKQSPARVA